MPKTQNCASKTAPPDELQKIVKFSNYNKKKMLRVLKHINCNADCEKDLLKVSRQAQRTKLMKEYINDQATKCQERVSQIMEKESNGAFVNLNDWAHMFTKPHNSEDTKDFCIPLVVELISKTEVCPSPEEMDGIDFRKLYGVITNLMAGFPTEELDATSRNFLHGCYKELLAEVNIEDVSVLQNIVDAKRKDHDPVLDCNNGQHLAQILQHNEINPLSLPVSIRK